MMGRRQSKMAPGVWDLVFERDIYHTKRPHVMRRIKRMANHHYRRMLLAEMRAMSEADRSALPG